MCGEFVVHECRRTYYTLSANIIAQTCELTIASSANIFHKNATKGSRPVSLDSIAVKATLHMCIWLIY